MKHKKKQEHKRLYKFSSEKLMIAAVAVTFAVTRAIYYVAGVRFDTWNEYYPMQFVFPELLKNDLWRSLFYLQSQPPLYNLFLGTVMKVFQGSSSIAFTIIYLTFGLMFAVAMYMLMRRLGVSRTVGYCMTLLFIASPESILFENVLYYSYPVALFLCLTAILLHVYIRNRNFMTGVLFFSLLASVVLMRSLFHIVWFIFIASVIFFSVSHLRKKTLIAAAVPFLLVLSVYAKNLYLFGQFSTSSWLGASFAKMTTFMLPEEERIVLAERGEITELAFIPAVQGLWVYHDKARVPKFKNTGVPIVDIEHYPSVGNNYNNPSIQSISRQYMKDALVVLKKHPGVYLNGLKKSFLIYFFPSADWFISCNTYNLSAVHYVALIYNNTVFGRFMGNEPGEERSIKAYGKQVNDLSNTGLLIFLWYVVAVMYAFLFIVRILIWRKKDLADVLTVGFLVLTILYVTAVGNFFEVLENMRFRFLTEPLVVVLIAMLINHAIIAVRHRKSTSIN